MTYAAASSIRQRAVGVLATVQTSTLTATAVVRERSVGSGQSGIAWAVSPMVRLRSVGGEVAGAGANPTAALPGRLPGIESVFVAWATVPVLRVRQAMSAVTSAGGVVAVTTRDRRATASVSSVAAQQTAICPYRIGGPVVVSATSFATPAPAIRNRALGPIGAGAAWIISPVAVVRPREVGPIRAQYTTTNPVPIPWEIVGAPLRMVSIEGTPLRWITITGIPVK